MSSPSSSSSSRADTKQSWCVRHSVAARRIKIALIVALVAAVLVVAGIYLDKAYHWTDKVVDAYNVSAAAIKDNAKEVIIGASGVVVGAAIGGVIAYRKGKNSQKQTFVPNFESPLLDNVE